MEENEWMPAGMAIQQMHSVYEKLTGQRAQSVDCKVPLGIEGLQDALKPIVGKRRLDDLAIIHSWANAMRAASAINICNEIFLSSLEAGKLLARPTGNSNFYFSPSMGSGMAVGLYGRVQCIPTRFWTMMRDAVPKQIDWSTGSFSFGTDKSRATFGYAKNVEFRSCELPQLEAILAKTVEVENKGKAAEEGAEVIQAAKQGRPKGSGGFAMQDEPLLQKMSEMIAINPACTVFFAAGQLASEAAGNAGIETKQRRLAERYREKYGVSPH